MTPRQQHILSGIRPTPLASYLKALAVLRLVTEQADPSARGSWQEGHFVLDAELGRDELLDFFMDRYAPSPIFSPWNKDGGFIKNKNDVTRVESATSPRWEALKETHRTLVRLTEEAHQDLCPDKPLVKLLEDHKDEFRRRLRNSLPDEALRWLDVCFVPKGDGGWGVFRLLGTGGCDAKAEFGPMFLKNLNEVLPAEADKAKSAQVARARLALELALFGNSEIAEPKNARALIKKGTLGQFSPGASGGPNHHTGYGGDDSRLTNPWDVVFCFEGALVINPATTTHGDVTRRGQGAFPFQVDPAKGLGGATTESEEIPSELWMPLWPAPSSLREIKRLFREGRARLGGRGARSATEMARAVATRGIDRGITAFQRFSLPDRNGRAHMAAPAGLFRVRDGQDEERFLAEVAPWIDTWRYQTRDDKTTPARMARNRRRLERALFEAAQFGGRRRLLALFEELGQAQAELLNAPRFRVGDKGPRIRPLAGLTKRWIAELHDGSHEFELAWAISGLEGAFPQWLRPYLEPLNEKGTWTDKSRRPFGASLPRDLVQLYFDRVISAERNPRAKALPRRSLGAGTLLALIEDRIEGARVGRLLHAMLGIKSLPKRTEDRPLPEAASPDLLPGALAVMKLALEPDPRIGGHLDASSSSSEHAPRRPELRILRLLAAGRVDQALDTARRRLIADGELPLAGAPTDSRSLNLAAALTLPVTAGLIHSFAGRTLASRRDASPTNPAQTGATH